MADDQSEAVFRCEVPLIAQRKAAGGAVVGVILGHHRVEIVAGHVAGGANAKRVPLPCVLVLGIDSGGIVGAAEKSELSVKTGISAFEGIDFHHAAHLPAKFRRNAGGIDLEGIDVIGFDFRTKAGRTVVGERDAIDDELSLIFRAAWVEDRIAFVEPARF